MKPSPPAPHVQRAIQSGQAHPPAAQPKAAGAGRPIAPHVQAAVAAVQAKPSAGADFPHSPRPGVAAHVQRAIAACQPKTSPAPRSSLAAHAQQAIGTGLPAPRLGPRPSPPPATGIVQPMKRKASNDGRKQKHKKKPRIGEGDGESDDDDFVLGVEIPVDLSLVQEEKDKHQRPSKIAGMDRLFRRNVERAPSPEIDEERIRKFRKKTAKEEGKVIKTLKSKEEPSLKKKYKVVCRRCGEYIRMNEDYKELGVRIKDEPKVPPLGHAIDYVEYQNRLFERSEKVDEKYRSAYRSFGAWDHRNVEYEHFDCNATAPKGSGSSSRGNNYVDSHHDEWLGFAKAWVDNRQLPSLDDGDSS